MKVSSPGHHIEGVDKIFSFERIVEERLGSGDLAADNPSFDGTPVGAGKVWKITSVIMAYYGTPPDSLEVRIMGLATEFRIMRELSVTSSEWYMWNGELYLGAEDYVRFLVVNSTLNDDAWCHYVGVQMNTP